jgi:hypothetical protein
MCTPKTQLEKRLVITVVTLVVVIILLLVTVFVLAAKMVDSQNLQRFVAALTPNL